MSACATFHQKRERERHGGKHEVAVVKNDAGQESVSGASSFRSKQEMRAYREMLLIRRFEEKAGQMYGMGLIGGFCHLYIGQEAVVVGMQMASKRGRPGHHRLSRPRPHAGLRHGPEGRDGRAHRTPRRPVQGQGRLDAHVLEEKHFYGGHGIVGAQVSLGTGLAFANRYRGNDNRSR